jgi:zinc transporter 5/7
MRLISGSILMPLQKPCTSGISIRRALHVRIGQLALLNILIELLWFYGITFCGPLRAILVFELNPKIIAIALEAVFLGSRTPSQTRGIFMLAVGALALIIMDEDSTVELNHADAHGHQSGLNRIFYHIMGWFGISDHKAGVVLLVIALCLKYVYDVTFRSLAVEIGGPKRLYSMVTVISAVFLVPFGVLAMIMTESFYTSLINFLFLATVAAVLVFIVDFFTESTVFERLPQPVLASARWAPITIYVWALVLSWLYYPIGPMGHSLSSGVVVTIICFFAASFILTSPSTTKAVGGFHVSVNKEGELFFTRGEAFLQKKSQSILKFCKETVREILANDDSKKIFYFLCVNLLFCGVEFFYGFINGSLGLISDGFHMLFDCTALVMGLVAAVMARSTASRQFSFGYGRVEILSGFINALFLIVIALMILLEAVQRLLNPPEVDTDKLMIVAVLGLCVNLFGMYALHGGHDHHHHGHSHGHSHGNANMEGVFLHVLADTLGSVFVIISTLLIQFFGWQWVDPLCSLILSFLILGSVWPLLKGSASVLLQCQPNELSHDLEHSIEEVLNIEGVISYSQLHTWQLKSENNILSIHLQITDEANDQNVRQRAVQIFKTAGVQHITVQVEKERFFRKIQNLVPMFRIPTRVDKGLYISSHPPHSHDHDHSHPHNHSHEHSHDNHHSHNHSHHDHKHSHGHH